MTPRQLDSAIRSKSKRTTFALTWVLHSLHSVQPDSSVIYNWFFRIYKPNVQPTSQRSVPTNIQLFFGYINPTRSLRHNGRSQRQNPSNKTKLEFEPPTTAANRHAIKRGLFQLFDKRLYTTVSWSKSYLIAAIHYTGPSSTILPSQQKKSKGYQRN